MLLWLFPGERGTAACARGTITEAPLTAPFTGSAAQCFYDCGLWDLLFFACFFLTHYHCLEILLDRPEQSHKQRPGVQGVCPMQ